MTLGRRLKVLLRIAGIKKDVTFHSGRHTFGSIMATRIPLPLLQELMQHTDIQTTMMYVKLDRQEVSSSLKSVNWRYERV